MDLKINKDSFTKALQRLSSVVAKGTTMPILANVLLTATAGKGLVLSATDLAIACVVPVGVCDVLTPGTITIDFKNFYSVIKNLPGETLSLKTGDTEATASRLIVKAGKAEFKLVGIDATDYPKMPDPTDAAFIDIDATAFEDMIQKTLFSASQDETRSHLCGCLLVGKDGTLRMVSTDGHRLSMVTRTVAGAELFAGTGSIVPRKGLLEIQKLLDSVEGAVSIALRGSNLYVRGGGVRLSVKLLDAQFPDYFQVIPSNSSLSAKINRQAFVSALKRVSLLSSDASWGVKFQFTENTLMLSSAQHDFGEGSEELSIEYSGKPVQIGFNASYLQESLNATTAAEVYLRMNDEISPGVLVPVDDPAYTCVVMPLRL